MEKSFEERSLKLNVTKFDEYSDTIEKLPPDIKTEVNLAFKLHGGNIEKLQEAFSGVHGHDSISTLESLVEYFKKEKEKKGEKLN